MAVMITSVKLLWDDFNIANRFGGETYEILVKELKLSGKIIVYTEHSSQ